MQNVGKFEDLLLFPKLTLQPGNKRAHPSAKSNVRAVLARIAAFKSDGFDLAWQAAQPERDNASRPKRSRQEGGLTMEQKKKRLENETFLATLRGLMKDGAFSKAVKHILSDGLHDASDPKV